MASMPATPTRSLSALVLLACHATAGPVIFNEDVGVQYLGRSGQIKLFPRQGSSNSTNPTDGKFVKIKWDKIEELNSRGRKEQFVNNFASQDFEWVGPYTSEIGNSSATRVDLRAVLNVGGNEVLFNISTWLLSSNTVVHNGNQTINVTKDSVKFTIDIADWPFLSTRNMLTFGASLLVPRSPGHHKSNDTHTGKRIRFGPGDLELSSQAVIDGRNRNISTQVFEHGAQLQVEWTFPSFQALSYDPSFNLNDASGGSSGGGSDDDNSGTDSAKTNVIIGAVVGTVVGTLIAGGAVFYFWRKRRQEADYGLMQESA